MKNRNKTVVRLCLDAMFVSLYVIFAVVLAFRAKTIEVSWASLPILLAAFLFSPADAVAVALCGSFLEQVLSPYGMSATTPLWMLPVVLQALFASVCYRLTVKKGGDKVWAFALLIVLSEILLTVLNVGASYADAYIFDYLAYLTVDIPVRLVNGLVRACLSAVLVPILLPPLRRLLKQHGFGD